MMAKFGVQEQLVRIFSIMEAYKQLDNVYLNVVVLLKYFGWNSEFSTLLSVSSW